MRPSLLLSLLLLSLAAAARLPSGAQPNLIFILVDDFGWGNFGLHNTADTADVVTPNLDALARGGLVLDRHYVFKYCSPTRSALQTGRNPIHVNVVNSPIQQHNPKDTQSGFQGVPRNMTGLAAKLKGAGYSTHQVGKWNAGMALPAQSPAGRGYDSSLFYYDYDTYFWNGTTTKACKPNKSPIVDLTTSAGGHPSHPAVGMNNTFSCSQTNEGAAACPHGYQDELFIARVLEVLTNASRTPETPFFLFYAPHAPHDPYEVPQAFLDKFAHITQRERQYYSAMVNYMDTNIGKLAAALKSLSLFSSTLAVLASDNGGPVGSGYGGNNWPLKGGKSSNWEGGIRSNSFAFGGALDPALAGTTTEELIGIEDWWSTFALLGGADTTDAPAAAAGLPPVDSLDMRGLFLPGGNRTSPRTHVIIGHSSDQSGGDTQVQGVLRADGYKLLVGKINSAFHQGPTYPNASGYPPMPSQDCTSGCLYHVFSDPTEQSDVAAAHPAIVRELKAVIAAQAATVFYPDRGVDDGLACEAALGPLGGFWGPFLE